MPKTTFRITALCLCGFLYTQGQNPSNITMPSPTPNPPILGVNSYTRATTSINCITNGNSNFKFGFVTSPIATNLLNLNISNYPNYVNSNYNNPSSNPSYYYTNPSLEAAVTPGFESVDDMGGFNYNVPIVCSPGTSGIEPKLSISYNSNSANNWLGLGFNLNGISKITRTGKSVFFDGTNGGITFSNSDVFELDGSRLLYIAGTGNGTYGSNGALYKTEVDNYYKIESIGTQGSNGPASFKVSTPEGLTMEYGMISSAKCLDVSNSEVLAWYINKVYDTFGNYMTYSYTNTGGELLIQSIDYTGNGNMQPYNKIEFAYCDRSDFNSYYINGKEFTRKRLLKSISCKALNNQPVRIYHFDYQYEYASQLNKITEVDAHGNALNPTYFEWRKEGKSAAYVYSSSFITSNIPGTSLPIYSITIPADLNGDGMKDLIQIGNTTSFMANLKLGQQPSSPTAFSNGGSISIDIVGMEYITSYVWDSDDNNSEEVYVIYANNNNSNYYIKKLDYNNTLAVNLIYSGTFPTGNLHTWGLFQNDLLHPKYKSSCYFYGALDITGDNLVDQVIVDQNQLVITPFSSSPISVPINDAIKSEIGDFNGNGKLDVYILRSVANNSAIYMCEIYEVNATNTAINLINNLTITTGNNPNMNNWPISSSLFYFLNGAKSIDFGDFNGDGLTDIMHINYQANPNMTASILKSNAQTFLPDNNPFSVPLLLNGYEANYGASDVNNDGTSDLIVSSYNPVSKSSSIDHYPSNGMFLTPGAGWQIYKNEIVSVMSDFNGDGALDILYQQDFYTFGYGIVFNAYNQNNKKLVSKVFSIQKEIKLKYVFIPGESIRQMQIAWYLPPCYIKTTAINNNQAFKLYKPALHAVNIMESPQGFFTYAYINGILHQTGKGFLGFEKIYRREDTKVDASGDKKGTYTHYLYSSTLDKAISVVEGGTFFNTISTFTTVPSKTAFETNTTLNYTQSGPNQALSSILTTSKDYLSSTYNSNNTVFDANNGGQILSTTSSNLNWQNNQVINSKQVNYSYHVLTNALNNNAPFYRVNQETTTLASGANTSIFQNTHNYQTNNGFLTSQVRNSNLTGMAVTTTFAQPNAFGHPTSITISALDLTPSRNSTVAYDATGRFVLQQTNSAGLTENFMYEPVHGNVIQSTDVAGRSEKYEYDGLGRLIKTTNSRGAYSVVKYEWYAYSNPLQYGFKISQTTEGEGTVVSYSDNKGNVVKTEETGFGGSTVVTDATYDNRNLLLSKSQSHYNNQTLFKQIVLTYDDYDRKKTITEQNNSNTNLKTINYQYNNLSSNTTYNKGFVRVQVPSGNGNGSYFRVTENNEASQIDKISNYVNVNAPNTANYTYNQFGLPVQLITSFPNGSGGATTSFAYDALGRRTSITDPSSGWHSYSFNSIGELTLSVNSNGSFSYNYDNLGRLTTKTPAGQSAYIYEYYTSGSGIQQLKKITGPFVTSEFNYDTYGRPSEKKETIGVMPGGKQFKTNLSYTKYDQVAEYTYPNNFKTQYNYDIYGNMTKIRNNNTVIWELTGMQGPGLIKDYKNGAGVTTQISYDNSLNLQQINLGGSSSQVYNSSASSKNMLNRSHSNSFTNSNNNESFDYDDFDRLIKTSFVLNNVTQIKHNYSYKTNGNLSAKDDCGQYVYSNTSPYQLIQIQNATNNTSLNTLNLTYNNINKISHLAEANTNKTFDFYYGNDEQRIKMDYKVNNQLQYTRFYQENYDRQETAGGYKEWCYINSPSGLAAVYYNNNGNAQLLNITTDHLGSPLLMTNQNGQLVEEQSFDAWGRRRNPTDWTYNNVPLAQHMIRGYTGHEHLDEVGIINMNGRIYDPVLGRFLQPDPLVQDPSDIQNYNRYSYVLNNPVNLIDPSGYENGKPVLYVDGVRIESEQGGYNFFLNGDGATGIASKIYLNVPNGGGGGSTSGTFYSLGGLSDIFGGMLTIRGGRVLVNTEMVSYNYTYQVRLNPITGNRFYAEEDAAAVLQWTNVDLLSDFLIAQSSGGIDPLGVGLGVGELAYQGSVYNSFGSTAETLNKLLKDGKYLHNGEVYYNGNYPRVTDAMKSSLSSAKLARNIGRGYAIAGIVLAGVDYINSNQTAADKARLAGSLTIAGTSAIPRFGPFISIGLGIADGFGAFDGIYNSFGH